MRAHTTFGIGTTVVTFDGFTYFVPEFAEHRLVAQRILSRQYAEPLLHQLVADVMAVRPGSMVHAGTFFGDMIPSFASKCTGTVYAFEPVVETYLCARQTVEVNALRNVVLNHAGLGASVGVAALKTYDGEVHRGGGAKVVGNDDGSQQMTTILAIDQFGIDDLSLLQLDVEGSEEAALRGAADTIAKNQPVIVVEDNRANSCAGLPRTTVVRRVRPREAPGRRCGRPRGGSPRPR